MPNWVINRIKTDKNTIKEIIKKHVTKANDGEECFDFETILKMPEELKIEKSSRSADGLKLYIAKINPFISNIGDKDEKMEIEAFIQRILAVFNGYSFDKLTNYLLRPNEVDDLRARYGKRIDETLNLGEKVFHNIEKYGVADWYDWSCEHWGTKWNACNTNIDLKRGEICFDTAWSPATPIIEALAKMYPNAKIIFSFAEEQMGFFSGENIYERGILTNETIYDSFSKEAYEMSFDLWGYEDEYEFNEEKNTYEYNGS